MKKILLLLLLVVSARQVNGQIISTVVGNGTSGFSGDGGQATAGELSLPRAVTFDATGNMYIADMDNNRIRKVNASGIITTVVGNGTAGFSGDGGAATLAELNLPTGMAFDATGNLYVADNGNNRIRKINTSGIISTVAGNGTGSFSGDGGVATAATLYNPTGVAFDASGNLYIADNGNVRIRKVSTSGIITTVAGNGNYGYSGDGGQATSAQLGGGSGGITLDAAGNIYIADAGNMCIRKVAATGIITTIAGNGTSGYSGDGGAATSAKLFLPEGVALDGSGNIYIADYDNNVIRKVNNLGIISTIAGDTTAGFSGDGGPAIVAELDLPAGVALDGLGNLYIADYFNMRIRKVTNVAGINEATGNHEQISIYPNPTSDQFFIDAYTTDKLTVDLFDVNGRHVFSASVNDKEKINVATLDNGAYTLTIKTADRMTNKKLVILR